MQCRCHHRETVMWAVILLDASLPFKLCSESSCTEAIFVFSLGLAGTCSCWLSYLTPAYTHTYSHRLHTRDGRRSLRMLSQKLQWDSALAKLTMTSIMEKQAILLSSRLLQGHKQVEVALNGCVFVWREVESLPDSGEFDALCCLKCTKMQSNQI